MAPPGSDLPMKMEFDSANGSLTHQLAEHIRDMVKTQKLTAGDRLPSTRVLASELKLARGTVTSAIELLMAEGLIETRIGAGTFIANDASLLQTKEPSLQRENNTAFNQIPEADIDPILPGVVDFRPCRPSLEGFPVQAWRRCLSLAASSALNPDYGDPLGDHCLRAAISLYLKRARGLVTDPDEIIITNGSVHAMHLLAHVYLSSRSTVFFEDPGYPLARQTFAMSGADLVSCAIDDDGIVVDALPTRTAPSSLVYVTPSHQFPTGGRLSLRRRYDLCAWAERQDTLIVEDDYDGEYRYDVPPLAPLASFDRNRVVYCGTFSKTMFPGLRIGFAVAPKPVVGAMARYRTMTEYAPSAHTQHALASFIRDGHYERHIHRMRRIYRKKRKFVVEYLGNSMCSASLVGLDSGLNGLLNVETGRSIEDVCQELRRDGVLLPPLSRYCVGDVLSANQAVIGYAAPSLSDIECGLDSLVRAVR
ncbi:MAG: PLP-dependent aminotransferase family protein [Pseudomonadota bacterium]